MLKNWKICQPLFLVWPENDGLDGILVPIRDSPLMAFLRRHLLGGGDEVVERLLVREFAKSGDQVLEIGASLGIVFSFLWIQVGGDGRVESVDGNPNLRNGFDRQLRFNGFRGEWVAAVCWPTREEYPPSKTRQSGLLPQDNLLVTAGRSVQALIDEGFSIQGMSGTVLASVRAAQRSPDGTRSSGTCHQPLSMPGAAVGVG